MSSATFENPLSKMKHQSTLYRRHERRRIKTYQLREDPRSAPVRVLSGLPGFRAFVKPFDPGQLHKKSLTEATYLPQADDSLDQIKFSFDDCNVFNLHDINSDDISVEENYLEKTTALNLNAIFFSGCIGGTMEAIFGRSSTDVLSRVSRQVTLLAGSMNSQFSNGNAKNNQLMFQSNANELRLQSVLSNQSTVIHQSFPKANVLTNERIIASAFAAGLLFSSNAFFRSILCSEDRKYQKSGSHPLSTSFVAASAATGFVTGTAFAPFELIRSRLLMKYASTNSSLSPFLRNSSLLSTISSKCFVTEMKSVLQRHGFAALFKGGTEVYSREMVGNVVYFSTYELMKSTLMKNPSTMEIESKQPTTLQILLSGATAGVAYWAAIYPIDTLKAMLQAQSITNPRFHTAVSVINNVGLMNLYRGYLSCIIRAAPANAMLCFGYEIALSTFSSDSNLTQY